MKKTLGMALVALALVGSATVANATPITLNILSDHCTGGCGPQTGGFGTISLTEVDFNSVAVVINLLNGNKFADTGFDGIVGFNLIGNPTVTYTDVSAGFEGLGYGPYSKFNGFGTFEYAIAGTFGNGGGNAVFGPLMFTVNASSAITAQSFLEFSSGKGESAYFVVDILSGTTGNTGLVDVSTIPNRVPDGGSTATLLGSVLLGVGLLRQRFGRG